MDCIERSNRFSRKRPPSALDNLWTDAQHVPVRRCQRQVCSSVGHLGLGQLTERDSAEEYTIAFDQCEVRRDDAFRSGERLTNLGT